MSESPDQQPCALVLEYIDFEWFGMDAESPVATELMAKCVGALSSLVVDRSGCRLVITGDFVRSVKDRLPESRYRDAYGLDRNTGMVAGKTMNMPDGAFDVLMHAAPFAWDARGDAEELDTDSVLHTVAHEALHLTLMRARARVACRHGRPDSDSSRSTCSRRSRAAGPSSSVA